MNATVTPTAVSEVTPNFFSMVKAEFYKILRQRGIMVTGIVILGIYLLYSLRYWLILNALNNQAIGPNGPVAKIIPSGAIPYSLMTSFMNDIRGFSGIFITVAAVIAIALEYQQGTIRVLLARGVGRLQLLGAKLAAILLIGAALTAIMLVLMPLQIQLVTQLAFGTTSSLSPLPSFFWNDTGAYILTLAVNLVATMALSAVFAVLGRSLAFGLSLSLPYWIVEGIISGVCSAIGIANNNNAAWLWAPQYFFGTNLTQLTAAIIPSRLNSFGDILARAGGGGGSSVPTGDATHTVIMLVIYVAAFLGFTGWLMQSRDVLQ